MLAAWLWDDNGVWKPYSAAAEKILETAFSQSKPHATLTFGSQQYKVDFSNMTQQNTRTGFARAVQRLVAGLPTPASTAGGCQQAAHHAVTRGLGAVFDLPVLTRPRSYDRRRWVQADRLAGCGKMTTGGRRTGPQRRRR